MDYDVLVIGGGLSGLAAASLLAKRGLSVAVVDKGYQPGGSCGAFRRGAATFDQGSSMMFGFGEKGFNGHRFVFNALEEPIDIIKHNLLYSVHFNGHTINFPAGIDEFVEETFWEGLLFRLGQRDIIKEIGEKEYRKMLEEELEEKHEEAEDKYREEFDKNGIKRLEIV